MKTILITGINGFLGSKIAIKLSKEHHIIGLCRDANDNFRIKDYGFKLYLSESDSVETIFIENKIDVIIHTATNFGRNESDSVIDILGTNLVLPITLYKLAKEQGSSLFINVDTFMTRYTKVTYLEQYATSKKQTVEWLKLLQGKCKIANLVIYQQYGPYDGYGKFVPFIIKSLKQEENIDLTLGEQQRDFIYVDDVVDSFLCVINSYPILDDYSEFHVGSGNPMTIKEFVLLARKICNSDSVLNFGAIPYRENEIMESVANNKELLELGWSPKYNIETGLIQLLKEENAF